MNLEQRLLMSVAKRPGKIVLRQDVARLGSASGVSLALANLVRRGKLVRLGAGVYAKARINQYTGTPTPDGNFDDLAVEALLRLGVSLAPSRALRLYNEGSTQIPVTLSFQTPGRRISRKIRFGQQKVSYEKAS